MAMAHMNSVRSYYIHGTDLTIRRTWGRSRVSQGAGLRRYHITRSWVYICGLYIPLVVRRVDRPFLVVTVCQETGHTEKPHPELLSEEERKKMMFIYEGYGRGKAKERRVVSQDGITLEGKIS
jgi:hypothetical protein